MIVLGILFYLSLCILYGGGKLLLKIYETLNEYMSFRDKEYPLSLLGTIALIASTVLAIVGAILYYHVCVATIEDIVKPHHPVEAPVPYGIAMILTSLVFTGSIASIIGVTETEEKFFKFCMAATFALLIVYLLLKSIMVLP